MTTKPPDSNLPEQAKEVSVAQTDDLVQIIQELELPEEKKN